MTRDRLGEGRHRLGGDDGVRLSVIVPERHLSALLKLRLISGAHKSEVVTVALDLVMSLPPDEIIKRVEERREKP